jgi:hypothetical protein
MFIGTVFWKKFAVNRGNSIEWHRIITKQDCFPFLVYDDNTRNISGPHDSLVLEEIDVADK